MAASEKVALTVDLVILTVLGGRLQVLLIERGVEPFAGSWALPGGFVETGEGLVEAARRELVEETGLGEGVHLEQLATYGEPDRDPRGRTVSVAYVALLPSAGEPQAGSDASAAQWVPIEDLPGSLAFDHGAILAAGVERARAKLEYTALGARFCPPEFTVAQLRAVYEAVWGHPIDPRNFHRKVTKTAGFVEPTGRTTTADGGRPAQLFRRGQTETLVPPLTRASA